MDRLVKADVKEVELVFKRGQKSTSTFRLTNLMHTMSVAVSLTTQNPSFFSFNKPFSIIPPLSSSSYTLFLSQPSDQPPLTSPPDAITVKTAILPLGKAHLDDLRRLFSKPGRHIFKDATLPISFVGPHVIEHLISCHNHIGETDLFLNKAISGCTGNQLTGLLKSAVVSGKANFVCTLIDHGGDVNDKDSKGRSLIALAVEAGNFDVVNVLISSGCEIDNSADHVLHYAAAINRVDLIEVLFRAYKNVELNSVDFCGRTPIHIAASFGYTEVIRFCLSVGGNPEVLDINRCSPLHLAAQEGHLDVVECLLEASSYAKYALNEHGKTAFALAVENGHSNLYDLLHLGDALNSAARIDDVNGMKRCLVEGANVNCKDQNGWTPLHRAAFKGRIESVKVLLNHGAQVNLVDHNGYTPLHCAVEAGHVEVALLLIAYGAKANVKRLKGLVPLNSDCFKNHLSLVQPLCHEKE
ncbi:ankyrin repeat domain-containing protein 50-like [Durio zibethinus]|uniref:Ankyrin repeat domain-containing protein 50-like n=1 Tax=Durio zibethinus TaxID=66656 RepID=A0A6P6A078_DURZI|nr:ankyrin repeat domain-containing protein 50-like [Durio zibethinus]